MTHEEVMAMTDEELRIKAAELDGWEVLPISSAREWIFGEGKIEMDPTKFRAWRVSSTATGECGIERVADLFVEHGKCPPDYPNDWGAAGGLAKRLSGTGHILEITVEVMVRLLRRTKCEITSAFDITDTYEEVARFVTFGTGEDAKNITRAFILAMESGPQARCFTSYRRSGEHE